MGYAVKEIFYSLQGEGYYTGRATVFCRFSGCNLWSGLEKHRHKAKCTFCDTDFVGVDGTFGGNYKTAFELATRLRSLFPQHISQNSTPYVVFTGGEPTLQLDEELIRECKNLGFEIGIETNGTRAVPSGVDWICVSPKPRTKLMQRAGHEIKLIYPQAEEEMAPHNFTDLSFLQWYLQPMAVSNQEEEYQNTQKTIEYCQEHPQWRLSLQMHKIIGVR